MDWRKFFDLESDDKDKKPSEKFSKFKKFEEDEDEDDWFDLEAFFNEFQDSRIQFHGFPQGMLKQFKEIIEAMKEIEDGNPDSAAREQQLKKFHDSYSDFKQKSDKDLDGKIYSNHLDSILKKINPEVMQREASEVQIKTPIMRKLTDEEKILDIIHGTYKEEIVPVKPRVKRQTPKLHKAPFSPHHFSALPPFHDFPPPSSSTPNTSTKSWGRTVISIRNPDGSYETRKIERTPDGNTKTTITKKDSEGNSSIQSYMGDDSSKANIADHNQSSNAIDSSKDHNERNLVTYGDYKIPCLW